MTRKVIFLQCALILWTFQENYLSVMIVKHNLSWIGCQSLNCELILSKLAFHFFGFIHFLFKGFRAMTDRAAKLLLALPILILLNGSGLIVKH